MPQNSHLPEDALELNKEVADWTYNATASPDTNISLDQLIDSEQLKLFIHESFSANPSLQQTLLTLKIRQLEKKQIWGNQLPTAEAGFAASKDEDQDTVYTGSFHINWELDLWLKLNNKSSAASKDVAEQLALYQSAKDTLAAEVMKTWLGLIAQQHAIRIQKQRLQVLQKNAQFIRQRYTNGLGNSADLFSARSSLSSSQATLVQYQESLTQQQRSFQTLLGRTAPFKDNIIDDYPQVTLPLADLPEQTLQRRPDLKAAYLSIEAASLRSSAAYKDLLPSINIQAALQDIEDSPRAALLTDPLWSLLGQLTMPIYQRGQLKAAAEIADLNVAYAYQHYRNTLLTAVSEVENALGQEQSLQQQQQYIEEALASSHSNLTHYQESYRAGLANILDLLVVEQNTYNLQAQLDQLIYQRLINRINLGLTLGLGVSQ